MEQQWQSTLIRPVRSRRWNRKPITLSWNGRYGWHSVRKNSRHTWTPHPHIDRKRTREQLRLLVQVINQLRRTDTHDQ